MNELLTAADFMNYEYCPRIVYFIHVLKQPQTKSPKQNKGLEKEALFKRETNRTKIIKKGPVLEKKYNVLLEYNGFITKVDCIAFNKEQGEAYPIQLKYSFKPKCIYLTQKVQLMLESYLIENVLKYKVPYGYIKYVKSNVIEKVYIGDNSLLFERAALIRDIIGKESFPNATEYKKRCVDCCYRRMCNG
ncbi:MAG: Dna2/Cas4 domain-containing protein [Candidatus Nanoarchaeia archaeon]|nr:Dna2/Cas4 domain-containing protein [Candidatus Nanoarchaeia archaeon]